MENREGYKKTKLGGIPEDWEMKKFDYVADEITDGTHFTPAYTNEGIPFLVC